MLLIDNKNINDPFINLALEEYCVRNLDMNTDYLLFYINEPSVIIGKHQNTIEEINSEFISFLMRYKPSGPAYETTTTC